MHHTFLRVDECDGSLAVDSAPDIFACKKHDLGKTPCGWKLDSRARCVDATDMRCPPSINDSGASMHHTFLRVDECDGSLAVDSAPDIFACKKDDLGKTPCVSNAETHGEIASQNS